MNKLTAKQLSILLWLKQGGNSITYITHPSELKALEDMRLIMPSLGNDKYILSQSGKEIVEKVLSSLNPFVMELSKSQYSNVPSERTIRY